MQMPTPLSRRMQLLLDEGRHRHLAEEAARTGRSVGALVREAIDARFELHERDERRRRAAAALLCAPRSADPEPDWRKIEREHLDGSADGVP
jgi:hypothetical protein